MNSWIHEKLNESANQVDEDFDLPEDLRLALMLTDIMDTNNINITEKQWRDYNRDTLGDEDFEK
jgi:hypothetical protein